eukprot:7103422-Pyramimonas_sp.AAC.1
MLLSDFRSHPYGIDFVERLNKQVTHRATRQGTRGKNMSYASREDLMMQAAVTHVHRGGLHPLKPTCMGSSGSHETLRYNPLLVNQIARIPDHAAAASVPTSSAPGNGEVDAVVE